MGREDTQASPLCPFSARKMVQVQPMQVSPGMPASRPWPGTRPRHPSPRYERAGAFQRPTAPSPHVHFRSQNATVETGEKVPRSPIGCCFCASQNTCHPCQMLKRPGLLSEPRRNHGDTLSTTATQELCRPIPSKSVTSTGDSQHCPLGHSCRHSHTGLLHLSSESCWTPHAGVQ